MEKVLYYIAGTLCSVAGAVMLTQWAYDPANAGAAFKVLGVAMLATGLIGGAAVIKKA